MGASVETNSSGCGWVLNLLIQYTPYMACVLNVLPDFPLKKETLLLSSPSTLLIQLKTFGKKTSPPQEKKDNYDYGKKDSQCRHMYNTSMASLISTLTDNN